MANGNSVPAVEVQATTTETLELVALRNPGLAYTNSTPTRANDCEQAR